MDLGTPTYDENPNKVNFFSSEDVGKVCVTMFSNIYLQKAAFSPHLSVLNLDFSHVSQMIIVFVP